MLAIKVKSHVSSLEGLKEGGDGVDGAIALMQHVRSGACADIEDIKNTLIEAWKLVDPAAEKKLQRMSPQRMLNWTSWLKSGGSQHKIKY